MLNALLKFLLPAGENMTPRAMLAALRYVPPFALLVWRSHRGYTTAMAVIRLLRAFVPIAALWAAKLILDEVVAIRDGKVEGVGRLWEYVALEVAVVLANDWLSRASMLVESLLGDMFSIHTTLKVMEHAATLDLKQFEDPRFQDVLERARRQTTGHIGLITMLLTMAQDAVTLVSLAGAILVFSPWLLLLLVVTLVGENGAGKTTLTKLLARLYDPTEGRILLDGRDLREYELSSVRAAIGVIFQDFVRYDLHIDENIGVGEIVKVGTYLDEANRKKSVMRTGSRRARKGGRRR